MTCRATIIKNFRKKYSKEGFTEDQLNHLLDQVELLSQRRDYEYRFKNFKEKTVQEQIYELSKANDRLEKKLKFKELLESETFDNAKLQDIMIAHVDGTDFVKDGFRYNYGDLQSAKEGRLANIFQKALGTSAQQKLLSGGKLDLQIAKAMEKLNRGESIANLPKEIQHFANGFMDVNKALLQTANDAGLMIKDRGDYLWRQTHDAGKINQARFTAWADRLLKEKLLDLDKTFGDEINPKRQREILQDIYNEIVGITKTKVVGLSKVGGKRSLHFKDAESFVSYNNEFGHGTMVETIKNSLRATAKASARNQVFGPDGSARWDDMEKAIREHAKATGDTARLDTFNSTLNVMQRNAMKRTIFGAERHEGLETAEKLTDTILSIQSIGMLSKAIMSTVTDNPISLVAHLKMTGDTKIKTFAREFREFFALLKPADQQRFEAVAEMNYNEKILGYHDRFGIQDHRFNANSAMDRYKEYGMKATLLPQQSKRRKTQNARNMMNHLASVRNTSFKDLHPRLRENLRSFEFDEKQWDIVKKIKQEDIEYKRTKFEFGGKLELLSPEAIRKADVNFFKDAALAAKMDPEKLQRDMAERLAAFLSFNAKVGSPETSVRETSFITQGLPGNDPVGMGLKLMFQFSSFPLAVSRSLRRLSLANPNNKATQIFGFNKDLGAVRSKIPIQGDLTALSEAMIGSTMLAAGGLILREIMANETPDWDRYVTKDFWGEALARGAIPLAGGYLVNQARGEYANPYRSLIGDLAGPFASNFTAGLDAATSLTQIWKEDKKGRTDPEKRAKASFQRFSRLIRNNAPGMFFTMPLINYTFMNDLNKWGTDGKHKSRIVDPIIPALEGSAYKDLFK